MGSVVALGETHELEGFALAGVEVIVADAADAVSAWEALDDDVVLVILSPSAAAAVLGELHRRPEVLTVVMP